MSLHGSRRRRNPTTAGDILQECECKVMSRLFCCRKKSWRVFEREWHWTTSLCTSSAEINSREWWVCPLYSQGSAHCALSLQSELFFKLSFVGLGAFISVSNEGHSRTSLLLLVPEHHYKGTVVMTAAYLDVRALRHHLRRGLVKYHRMDLTCGESRSR